MVVIGSAFLLYALTRSENLALAHDSLNYLSDIEAGGARLFHRTIFSTMPPRWSGSS